MTRFSPGIRCQTSDSKPVAEGDKVSVLSIGSLSYSPQSDDNAEDDELTGLECGADDYISKLASLKLILARIELILKRNTPEKEEIIECNGIEINQTTHIITVDGVAIEASLKEYDLLVYFIKNKNKEYNFIFSTHLLRVLIFYTYNISF